MAFIDNTGINVDISNDTVKRYIGGTPNLDKHRTKVTEFAESIASEMSERWRTIFTREFVKMAMSGLSEDMINDGGFIKDPAIKSIVSLKIDAFKAGWTAGAGNCPEESKKK